MNRSSSTLLALSLRDSELVSEAIASSEGARYGLRRAARCYFEDHPEATLVLREGSNYRPFTQSEADRDDVGDILDGMGVDYLAAGFDPAVIALDSESVCGADILAKADALVTFLEEFDNSADEDRYPFDPATKLRFFKALAHEASLIYFG